MPAVDVQVRTSATEAANGWVRAPTMDIADPDMTREARQARAAWRRKHLDEWHRDLKALYHFDPGFIYDPAHEYDQESTTDPDYGADGVHFLEFDADGVVSPLEKRARKVQERSAGTAADTLAHTDLEADYEVEVRFRPDTIARVNQATNESHPVRKGVRPDMLVRAAMSVLERERWMPNGILRLDLDAPVPPLVLEVVSEGSANRDLHYKKLLYAAAGVSEYLVYDLGGKRGSDSPRELLMYRLEGGSYRQEPAADEYWSNVFGTHVRFQPDARERDEEFRGVTEEERSPPRFQWWDPDTERWRDRETDREHERIVEAVEAMRLFLEDVLSTAVLDRIESVWRCNGPPEGHLQAIHAVLQTPAAWRTLLPDNPEGDSDPDQPTAPRNPGPTLGTR